MTIFLAGYLELAIVFRIPVSACPILSGARDRVRVQAAVELAMRLRSV